MTLHQFPNPESIAGSGKGTQFPGSLSYFPVLCSVLGAADIKTTMPALKVCTFLVTPVLLSLFQGRGFPVTGQTFSPLQPTRSLFGFPCYAPSLSLFRSSPPFPTPAFTPKPTHPRNPSPRLHLSAYPVDCSGQCLVLPSSVVTERARIRSEFRKFRTKECKELLSCCASAGSPVGSYVVLLCPRGHKRVGPSAGVHRMQLPNPPLCRSPLSVNRALATVPGVVFWVSWAEILLLPRSWTLHVVSCQSAGRSLGRFALPQQSPISDRATVLWCATRCFRPPHVVILLHSYAFPPSVVVIPPQCDAL